MRKYWIDKSFIAADKVTFKNEVFHHIFDVCRQEVGSRFEVLIGDGKAYLVEVRSVTKKAAEAQIISTRLIPDIGKPHIHLALSIPRFHVMEAVIEKAVELGVFSIHPFFSEFSFVRTEKSLPESKMDRWNKIIVSATQQCGRGELMSLMPAQNLTMVLDKFNHSKQRFGLFAYEGETTTHIKDYLHAKPDEAIENLWIFIGSEGGFSRTEVQGFDMHGLKSVSLGEQVLRVETACIALISVLKYEFELMR